MKRNDIVGVINAGGQSRRMGKPKALLSWKEQTFLERALFLMESHFEKVIIIANEPEIRSAGFHVFPDKYPDAGPMGGIATALHLAEGKNIFVLGCDLPLVTSDLISFILKKADPEASASVPVAENHIQSLCALYSQKILPILEKSIQAKELKLNQTLKEIQPDFIPISSKNYLHYSEMLFFNVNTPEDLSTIENDL